MPAGSALLGSEKGGHLLPYFAPVAGGTVALFVEREGGPYQQSAPVSVPASATDSWIRIVVDGNMLDVAVLTGSPQGSVVGHAIYTYDFPFAAPTFVGAARRSGTVFSGSVNCVHLEPRAVSPLTPPVRAASPCVTGLECYGLACVAGQCTKCRDSADCGKGLTCTTGGLCLTRRLPAGIRPQESCVLEELTHGEELVYFYHDDEEKDDIPGSARDIENGFETPNAFYVGNDRVATAEIEHFRLCYEVVVNGTCKKKCHEHGERDYGYTGKVDPRMARSTLHKAVWAQSGQIEHGDSIMGNNGDILTHSYAETACWSGYDSIYKHRQSPFDNDGVHMWGCGPIVNGVHTKDEMSFPYEQMIITACADGALLSPSCEKACCKADPDHIDWFTERN